jgi:hypothetical protein
MEFAAITMDVDGNGLGRGQYFATFCKWFNKPWVFGSFHTMPKSRGILGAKQPVKFFRIVFMEIGKE